MLATQSSSSRENPAKSLKKLRKSLVLTLSLSIAIPLLSAPSAQAAAILTNYYQFEGNGLDSIGGQNASVAGSVSVTSQGKYGTGYASPGGSAGYLDMGPNLGRFGTADFTIGFWFRSLGGDGHFINKRLDSLHFITIQLSSAGQIQTEFRSQSASNGADIFRGPATPAGVSYKDGTWHHFAIVRSGSVLNLYVDGQVSATDTGMGDMNFNYPIYNNANFIFGGSNQFAVGFRGFLDDLAIYSSALSQTEVQASMLSVTPPPPTQTNQAPLTINPISGTFGTPISLSTTGGSGSGALTFSPSNGTAQGCAVSGSSLTSTSAGTCLVTATKAADSQYFAATSAPATFTFTPADQATLTLANQNALVGTPISLATSGGSGNGAVTYAVNTYMVSNSAGCSISGTVLSAISAGTCSVIATKAADGNYNAINTFASMTFTKADQAPLIFANQTAPLGTPISLATSGGSGSGAVTYSVQVYPTPNTAGCSLGGSSLNIVIATSVGTCSISAEKVADGNYNSAMTFALMTFTQANQNELIITSVSGTVLTPLALTAIGGSVTGTPSFTTTDGSATGCLVNGSGALISTTAGTCIVTASLAGDSIYNSVSSAPTEVSLSKLAQADISLVTLIGVAGRAVTVIGTGGSGTGEFSFDSAFKKLDGCFLAGDQLTATGPATCTIRLVKLGDGVYETLIVGVPVVFSASGTELSITSTYVQKARGYSLATLGGFGTGAVSFLVLESTGGGICTLSGTLLRVPSGTTCLVRATKEGDGTFARQFVTANIFSKVPQPTTLAIDQSTGFVGTPLTLTTTGGDGVGAVVFEVLTGDCTISGNLLLAASVGGCLVQAVKGQDADYLPQDARATITFSAVQAPLNLADGSATYGETINLAATGGSGSGTVTYALVDGATNSAGCSIVGTVLSSTSVGTCSVIATNPGDSVYSAVSSNPANFTIGAKAITVNVANGSKTYGEIDPSFTYSATGLVGSDLLTGTLSRVAGENVGTYAIGGTLANSNYAVTVTPGIFTINAKSATVTANAASKMYGEADPSLTYTSTGLLPGDTFTGSLSRAAGETAGTYVIGLGTLRNNNYLITFNGAVFTINKAAQIAQAALVVTSIRGKVESKIKLTTSGGSGTGAITYTVTNGTAKSCTITNGVLTAKGQGTCLVTALKAGDVNYLAASSIVTKVAFDSSNPENNGKKNDDDKDKKKDEDKSDSGKKDDKKSDGNGKDGSKKGND